MGDSMCRCKPGWRGERCNEVSCPNDCGGRGLCVEREGKGKCVCSGLYAGEACQVRRCPDDCNGRGQCDNTTGECKCSFGWEGLDCSLKAWVMPKRYLCLQTRFPWPRLLNA